MIKEKRLKNLREYILKNESASLDELVSVFNVSKNTIRRDVQELTETGNFKKIYGGVAVVKSKELVPFHDRKIQNQQEKRYIAELASKFIENGDIIFIDSGTTTIELFDFIKDKELTIVTNNIEFITLSIPYEQLNIICTGGILERKTRSFVNFNNPDFLENYNINKAFMASTGISIKNGVTNSSPLESNLKQMVVKKCKEVYLMIDDIKFDKQGLITYCSLEEIDYIITNKKPPEEFHHFFQKHNIDVIYSK